jgi:hypothetical protein
MKLGAVVELLFLISKNIWGKRVRFMYYSQQLQSTMFHSANALNKITDYSLVSSWRLGLYLS